MAETPETVTLESLVGEHTLDAVDTYVDQVKQWGDHFEDANCIRFRLDGVVYTAIESPDDGYRSSLGSLFVSPDDKLTNVFPPIRVLARMKGNENSYVNDTIQFLDMVTGKVVMEVGTDNTDDYYPWFVGTFNPENMATNAAR